MPTVPSDPLAGIYDFRLVALSVLISALASLAASDLGGRVTASPGSVRSIWLMGGAAAMGIGIWSMHYIGMLAYNLPVAIFYHCPTVLLSLLAATLASAVALLVVSRNEMGLLRIGIGGLLMGSGIAAMHYVGMDAMRLPATCQYSSAASTKRFWSSAAMASWKDTTLSTLVFHSGWKTTFPASLVKQRFPWVSATLWSLTQTASPRP
jgi:NO-binding membrane sensor protein with MHYT domain